jgi:hypothetical protein
MVLSRYWLEVKHHSHVLVFQIVAMENERPSPSPMPHSNSYDGIRAKDLGIVKPIDFGFADFMSNIH